MNVDRSSTTGVVKLFKKKIKLKSETFFFDISEVPNISEVHQFKTGIVNFFLRDHVRFYRSY